jgi:hypothetical protein
LNKRGNSRRRAVEDRIGFDPFAIIGAWHWQRHNRGLVLGSGRSGGERKVIGKDAFEGRVDEGLNRLGRAIAFAWPPLLGPASEKPVADFEIYTRLGAAEAIDRLFGSPTVKSLSGGARVVRISACSGLVSWNSSTKTRSYLACNSGRACVA